MNKLKLFIAGVLITISAVAQNRKIIADCTITYDISTENSNRNALNNTSKIVYIKGKEVRIDILSSAYSQTTIYNYVTGEAVILKEVGSNKYMSVLNENAWKNQNSRYASINVTFGDEEKIILGYRCKKAVAHLKDGTSFTLYYTTAIAPSVQENPYQFKNIPGFVLQYESQEEGLGKITFTATKLDLSPVPVVKFEIPKSGYRILQ